MGSLSEIVEILKKLTIGEGITIGTISVGEVTTLAIYYGLFFIPFLGSFLVFFKSATLVLNFIIGSGQGYHWILEVISALCGFVIAYMWERYVIGKIWKEKLTLYYWIRRGMRKFKIVFED